jgi:regulator of protease activity HflC (stomatin/prohibitin superfamily)
MTNGFGFLSLAGWALLGILALYVLFVAQQRSRGSSMKFSTIAIAVLLLGGLLLTTLANSLTTIAPQERGIVLNAFTGYRPPALEPGVHFVLPFVENVKRYNIGQQNYTMSKTSAEGQVKGDDSVTARTSDGQEVFIDASVQYAVDQNNVIDLFVKWQDRYEEGLVRPQSRSIIYNKVAEYKVEEVYSVKRDQLQKQIADELRKAMAQNGLTLTSFLLRNVTFNQEYANSVEQKQIAQQQAERAKFLVEQERQEAERVRVQAKGRADAAVTAAEGEAQARVINAKAEAESLKLISDQLRDNPNLLAFRYIEKLSPGVQTIFLPSNQPFLLDPKSFVGPVTTQQSQPEPTKTP